MTQQKIGPREQQLREMRENRTAKIKITKPKLGTLRKRVAKKSKSKKRSKP